MWSRIMQMLTVFSQATIGWAGRGKVFVAFTASACILPNALICSHECYRSDNRPPKPTLPRLLFRSPSREKRLDPCLNSSCRDISNSSSISTQTSARLRLDLYAVFERAACCGSGAFSDADVVRWHPNSHYVAAGCSDRTIRIWDIRGGRLQRILTGHRAPVSAS